MIVGMTSALLAALMALVANDLKRVLAYSTISQFGYMIHAIGAGFGPSPASCTCSAMISLRRCLFLAAGAVIHGVGTRDMYQWAGSVKDTLQPGSLSSARWRWPDCRS